MKNKKPDSVKFIIHSVVFALMFLAFLHAFEPVIAPDPREPEVRALAKTLVVVPPETLQERFVSSEKPTLLFVYASWCGYCQQVLPYLLQLKEEGRLDHVNPLFLSLDGDKRKLAIYLVHAEYANKYTHYIIPEWNGDATRDALQKLGSRFNGAIPYIALFNKDKPVAEILGLAKGDRLQKLLQHADKK